MLDFSSALYLGLRHPSGSAGPWDALTLGRPAALQAPPGASDVASELAALQGCEAATLLPSTLHLFWDLFGIWGHGKQQICVDASTYAIARWGVQRGALLGARVAGFDSGDLNRLEALLTAAERGGRRPLIVSDGWRPGGGHQPPLVHYAAMAVRHGGCLVVDDTQALGVFGHSAEPHGGYGSGGGGSLRKLGLAGPHIVVGASLAKAFGVPLAVLSGSRALVQGFEATSETRVHASPPSQAVIQAARHALEVNRRCGDALRQRLLQRVRQFRSRLAGLGLRCLGGDFPVQTPVLPVGIDVVALHAGLLLRCVRAVLHGGPQQRLSFIFNAAHTAACIDQAVEALGRVLRALCGGGPTFEHATRRRYEHVH